MCDKTRKRFCFRRCYSIGKSDPEVEGMSPCLLGYSGKRVPLLILLLCCVLAFFSLWFHCCRSFISGADGGLDFGVLKVLDETKQTCSLKNKGKFEITFNFAFESTDGSPSDVGQLFTVIPNRGLLLPTDRPTQVQVIFRSKSEITIKDQPILKCQVNAVISAF